MARLYANENFPLPVVMELRRVGHDVLTVRVEFGAIGEAGGVDDEPEAFHALHGMMPDSPRHRGVVDADFAGQAQRIHASLALHANLLGRLVRVNRPAGVS